MSTNENDSTARRLRVVDSNAAQEPRSEWDLEQEPTAWSRFVDLDAALAGAPPPQPQVCRWQDVQDGKTIRRGLFYPNEVHAVFGDPEAMKSWLLLFTVVQEIRAGHHVIYVDMEANDRSIVERLRLLGAVPSVIDEFFHYARPDGMLNAADHVMFKYSVRRFEPTLVVLDGVTEAYAALGLSIMSPEDTASWFRGFSRRFLIDHPTREYPGPAVVELDHVVKDREGRGNGWALGSIHKKAGIKGSAFRIESVEPFGKGRHGRSRLFLEKDSPGGIEWVRLGKRNPPARYVGEFHCDATSGDGVDAWIEPPDIQADADPHDTVPLAQSVDFRTTMHEVWKYIVNHPASSDRLVRSNVSGSNEKIATALELLEQQGFIRNESANTRHRWVAVEGKEYDPIRVPGAAKGGA